MGRQSFFVDTGTGILGRHRWTGRYEAHLWDNSCRREGQSRKGRQDVKHQNGWWMKNGLDWILVHSGTQEEAAEAYDIAAIKFRGLNAVTNFDMSRYDINSIVNNDLPIGGLSGRPSKASESSPSSSSDCMSVDMKHQLHRQAPSASLGLATIPMTQDHDYWSLLALHHQASGFGLFSASGGTMDFATAAAPSSKRMLEHQQEQSQSSSCSPVPYATCVACGGGHSDEGSNIMGGLAAPPSSYQQQPVSKPHVAAFQSAIFGME
ncbi:hypothetical protein BHE74_00046022 [Ensete ventricosum]|nr:hypothetical protein BHE74_00046022 [Ensete ventricosum]